jgi:DNA-binding response OmpR family regulator
VRLRRRLELRHFWLGTFRGTAGAIKFALCTENPAEVTHDADTAGVTESILIVEDSASVRRLIEVCLRELNLDIIGAADGVAGLKAAREALPAAVVLDIGLPGMDGWEVLRRLRADDATKDTKVLILTAHAQPEVAVQAQEGGADDFMTKPFRPTDLRDRVAKLIAS